MYCTKRALTAKETGSGIESLIARASSSIKSISSFRPLPSCSIGEMNKDDYVKIKNSGVYFDEATIDEEYHDALMSECGECDQVFKAFDDLEMHAKRAHKK